MLKVKLEEAPAQPNNLEDLEEFENNDFAHGNDFQEVIFIAKFLV